MDLNSPKISRIIDDWIEEDIGKGDMTSFAITQTLKGDINYLSEKEIQSLSYGNFRGHVKR